MPLHLPPLSRRKFLSSVALTAAGLLTFRTTSLARSDDDVDPDYLVLIADTHIDQNPNRLLRGINPAENLEEVVQRIVQLRPRPAAVIINGDAANVRGLPGEYGLLSWILRPLSAAGIPIHITMGNHDDRGPFYSIMSEMRPSDPPIEQRHLAIVETPRVRLVLLDTLDQVNNTPGLLGAEQLIWLDEVLRSHTDKPILVMGHHFPETGSGRGLLDSDQLFRTAHAHPHVKAYIYGHSHRWNLGRDEDLLLINQPATAHVFREDQTQAFLHARFKADELQLRLDCLDRQHSWHGKETTLTYR